MSNANDKIKSVILRLILEYETYENWQNCVSISFTNRINWLWEFVENFDCRDIYDIMKIQPQDSCHQINVRLIKLMDLMHRVEDLPADDDFESITPFEEILELTDQMLDLRFKEPVKASLLKVKKVAQLESVIECIRQKKMNLGNTVFERVWTNAPFSLKSSKSQLSEMLKNEAENSNIPHSMFNDSFKQFLSKHFNNLPTPFLTTFADKLIKASPSDFGVFSKKKKLVSEVSSCKHMLVKCWLSHYFCHLAFINVQKLHTSEFSWILKFILENNLDFKSSLLVRFLFKYNEHLSSTQMKFLSPLELSLSLLEETHKNYPETMETMLTLLDAMKYQLKKAAVLGWCLENNYENGRKVCEKLVETEELLYTDLEGFLKGEKPLDSYDKSDLHSAVQQYMEAVFKQSPPVFLVATAEKVLQNIEKLAKEQMLEVVEEVKSKEEGVEEKVALEEDVSEAVVNGDGDDVNNPALTPTANTPTANAASKARKKVWLEEEEELIYKGTKIFGVGNWSTIARKLLIGRTNTDVKDKWRTMVKQGKVRRFESRGFVSDDAASTGIAGGGVDGDGDGGDDGGVGDGDGGDDGGVGDGDGGDDGGVGDGDGGDDCGGGDGDKETLGYDGGDKGALDNDGDKFDNDVDGAGKVEDKVDDKVDNDDDDKVDNEDSRGAKFDTDDDDGYKVENEIDGEVEDKIDDGGDDKDDNEVDANGDDKVKSGIGDGEKMCDDVDNEISDGDNIGDDGKDDSKGVEDAASTLLQATTEGAHADFADDLCVRKEASLPS